MVTRVNKITSQISEANCKLVPNAAKKLNYSSNIAGRKLVSGKLYTIDLVLCQSPEQIFTDACLPRVILCGAVSLSTGSSQALRPVERNDIGGSARLIAENPLDGILLSGPHPDDEAVAQLSQERVPVVWMVQILDKAIPPAEYYDPALTTIYLPGSPLRWAGGARLIRIIHAEGLNDASLLLESNLFTRQASI